MTAYIWFLKCNDLGCPTAVQCYGGHLLNSPLPPTLAFSISNVASVWMTAVVSYCGFGGFYLMQMF